MSDREIDRQLVARAQRGDKRAFELLVEKYQRKLGRLLSRFIRDPAEVEDVTQEAFIKAYRALPAFRGDSAFYTWLYRIGINTAKNYLMAMGRRAPTSTEVEAEEAEGFEEGEQLRDINTPESLLLSNEIAQTVNSTKSMTGHLLGAAGGIEAVFSILAMRDQVSPPTINLRTPDPACDLDYVPNAARKMPIRIALSNSFGFGGTNGTLALAKV